MKVFFSEFNEGMQLFGKKVSIFINTTLLIFVYVFGIGLSSIIAKVFNKHFLKLSIGTKKTSYWEDSNMTKEELREFLKQY